MLDPIDDRSLWDRLHLIERDLPDSPAPAKTFFQDWLNMPDSDIGTMLMLGSILCLAVGFALQRINGDRGIVLPVYSWIFIIVYYFGLLMTIRETQVFGLYEYSKHFVAVTVFGLICTIILGLFCIPLLRFISRRYDSTMRFKEEVLHLLVRDYGLPENAKDLVALFAKKRLQSLYANMQEFATPYIDAGGNLYKKFCISFAIFTGSVEQKIREVRKMVA